MPRQPAGFFCRRNVHPLYSVVCDTTIRTLLLIITETSCWAPWRLKSPASGLFTQSFVQSHIKGNIKAPRHWPLLGESTGDRWNPLTKGQLPWLYRKCFHLMTWSWSIPHQYQNVLWSLSILFVTVTSGTLKRKCHHFDEIFITGCTESCQNDNFQCSQWRKFRQNDDISVSVNDSPYKGPVTRKMFSFDDVMINSSSRWKYLVISIHTIRNIS